MCAAALASTRSRRRLRQALQWVSTNDTEPAFRKCAEDAPTTPHPHFSLRMGQAYTVHATSLTPRLGQCGSSRYHSPRGLRDLRGKIRFGAEIRADEGESALTEYC